MCVLFDELKPYSWGEGESYMIATHLKSLHIILASYTSADIHPSSAATVFSFYADKGSLGSCLNLYQGLLDQSQPTILAASFSGGY